MTKFNFKQGSATPKGKLHTTRLISKDHSIYPLIFDEVGNKRSPEKIKANLENVIKTEIMNVKTKHEKLKSED